LSAAVAGLALVLALLALVLALAAFHNNGGRDHWGFERQGQVVPYNYGYGGGYANPGGPLSSSSSGSSSGGPITAEPLFTPRSGSASGGGGVSTQTTTGA